MPNFAILLAPSESKLAGGNPLAPDMFDYRSSTTFNYFHELNSQRRQLIEALQVSLDGSKASLEKIFGTKAAATEAVEINREIFGSPLMSALERYSPGVLYKAMDFSSLPTGAQRRLLENGIIISGLFGLLRPDDLIPDYRIKMDAAIPKLGKVSTFWKKTLSDSLNRTVKGQVVWNLLPNSHADAWDDDASYVEMIVVRFVDEKKGKRTAATKGVKALRGKLVNYIVSEMGEDVEALNEWKHPAGYVIDLDESSLNEETKLRTITMVRKV